MLPELVARGTQPIVVIGPRVSTAQGLPMTEVLLVLDGTPESDALLDVAAAWASTFRLGMTLTMVPAPGVEMARPEIQQYLDLRAELADTATGVGVELVGDDGGIDGLVSLLEDRDSTAVMMSPGPADVGLSRLAESVILHVRRAGGAGPPSLIGSGGGGSAAAAATVGVDAPGPLDQVGEAGGESLIVGNVLQVEAERLDEPRHAHAVLAGHLLPGLHVPSVRQIGVHSPVARVVLGGHAPEASLRPSRATGAGRGRPGTVVTP